AVIGSGIMGSGIACHLANIGVEVLLLDVVPDLSNIKPADLKKIVQPRNFLAERALAQALKQKPAPLYHPGFINRITPGNIEDHLPQIAGVDWIIEVVVERLDIKQQVFASIEKYRKPGTLITSNTSGIPIHLMSEGRSLDFQEHFCGTHFFNPARYLDLFEIITGPKTKADVLSFLSHYAVILVPLRNYILGKNIRDGQGHTGLYWKPHWDFWHSESISPHPKIGDDY
ncbi:MAG: hypothetical protein RLZZ463_1313, partial [Bacteroidota bacterium]